MAIRPAAANEADRVAALISWTADLPMLIDDGVVWVLTQDSDIVGLTLLRDEPDHLLIDALVVDPAHLNRGFGNVLLSFAEREARKRGYDQVRLSTSAAATETLGLCRSFGYREAERAGFMSKPVL